MRTAVHAALAPSGLRISDEIETVARFSQFRLARSKRGCPRANLVTLTYSARGHNSSGANLSRHRTRPGAANHFACSVHSLTHSVYPFRLEELAVAGTKWR